ncbi:hypothetical protein V7S43_004470 [Phytophthora oleae]|uniref:Uncharacterized protein n=1 Tax=Phytophthora oleae TaxID=2107226 RepID=A0ABD3FT91_9STRA
MVLTRAQARAAAEAARAAGYPLEPQVEGVEGVVTEVNDEERLAVVSVPPVPQSAGLASQVSRIVDNFWTETHRIAAETSLLQRNQIQQAAQCWLPYTRMLEAVP